MTETNANQETHSDGKIDLYKNQDNISLYRFENPNIIYDKTRDGNTSIQGARGVWFTDNINDLLVYTASKIGEGDGGIFVVVRISKKDLGNYLPDTNSNVDWDKGNYIIPKAVQTKSRVEITANVFESSEVGRNLKVDQYSKLEEFINLKLSDEAVIEAISSH